MAFNKLALLRYKTIDRCLQNRMRKWTLEHLIDAVSDALYEYEGIHTGVGKRTIQLDIQTMRSDKLGYNAPIIITDKKYYSYEEADYSITRSNISATDFEKLQDVVKVLKQFKGFGYFDDISTMVSRLENKISQQGQHGPVYIDFEKNELLKGLEWIDDLLLAIKNEQCLDISYRSFKARNPGIISISPYLLKEYRNRWFVLCKRSGKPEATILALDRMEGITPNHKIKFNKPKQIDVAHFFDDVIGVTKTLGQKTSKIILHVTKDHAPYVLTKPLHSSQKVLKEDETGLLISLEVIPNFELEGEIMGFAEGMEVRSPRNLRNRIEKKIQLMMLKYQLNE